MQSKSKDVTTYLKEVPAERKAALAKLGEVVEKMLKATVESTGEVC